MDDDTFQLLTNDDVIAINQDPLAAAPVIEKRQDGIWVYRKALADDTEAIGIFNRSEQRRVCRLNLEAGGRDLWNGENVELAGDFSVAPHGVRLFRKMH